MSLQNNKQDNKKNSINYFIVIAILLLVIFYLVGYILGRKNFFSDRHSKNGIEMLSNPFNKTRYKVSDLSSINEYLNPRLKGEGIKSFSNKFASDLKNSINEYISKVKIDTPAVKHVSVYFRDLNAGLVFGINEQEEFIPGSLLKLPLMISVFKKSESNASFLDQSFLFNGGAVENKQFYKPSNPIEVGKVYSVGELIEHAIIFSDNNAALLLKELVDENDFVSIYEELGIKVPKNAGYTLTVQTYASFFRILYNASFLNKHNSGKALQMLSEAEFSDGLVSGVPSEIKVAHKFGERLSEGQDNQLHDCGIIYYPEHPYVLCVMTKGSSIPDMAATIKDISKTVFEKVKKDERDI
jgi:beta-lactamase class A